MLPAGSPGTMAEAESGCPSEDFSCLGSKTAGSLIYLLVGPEFAFAVAMKFLHGMARRFHDCCEPAHPVGYLRHYL